jgi:integrase/recombinase XerD
MLSIGFSGLVDEDVSSIFTHEDLPLMTIRVLPSSSATDLTRLADDYLNHCRARGLSARSEHQYSYSIRAVFLPWCEREGISAVAQLDRRAVDRFTSELLVRKTPAGTLLSRYSVATYIRPIRLLLNWAREEGETVQAKPQLPRCGRPIRDVLSRAEFAQLELAAGNERDRVIIRTFADCGLRLEELTRLTDVDLIRGGRQAHLRVHGKRDRVRDVPVPPSLVRRLDRLIAERPEERNTNAIFLAIRCGPYGEFEALTKGGVYQVVKNAVARSGIQKRVHPHLLRHSWITEMLRRNMNPVQLSYIAGASLAVIATCYAHLTREDAYDSMLRALMPRSQR